MMMWLGWDACVCGFNSTYMFNSAD
jgi:hypothetical protein